MSDARSLRKQFNRMLATLLVALATFLDLLSHFLMFFD